MKKQICMLIVILTLTLIIVPTSLANQRQKEAAVTNETNLESIPTNQIIIKFEETVSTHSLLKASGQTAFMKTLSEVGQVSLQYGRLMSNDAHVLRLPEAMPPAEVAIIANRLANMGGVLYAEPDYIRRIIGQPTKPLFIPTATSPNDTFFSDQWHYDYVAGSSEGVNLKAAWDINTGSSSTVVAVIDTGILDHADLAGRTVPGYDFISISDVGNDGNGRDSDPSDPGDWISANECGGTHSAQDSSWHGTHVAGTIGAATNNGSGVAGVNWNAKILPVRVLGKCGGLTSDIVDGMLWAAGLSVSGVPTNANPADVINLSLGGDGACSITEQAAINAVVAAGTTVVVAAGNESMDASNASPANCNNVITVAANDRNGNLANYSNYGNVVEITAPGGETNIFSSNGILSTLDNGLTTPANDDSYSYYQGTSMAAPHVSGVVSLIIAENPSLTPSEISRHLQYTARAFPSGSSCNTDICGAGIADAFNALSTPPLELNEHVHLPLILSPPEPPSEIDATGDTMIAKNYPDSNFCSFADMLAGYDDLNNGKKVRSLVQFDVTEIPAGANISQATLHLRLYSSFDFPNKSRTITTYRVGSAASPCSMTWNNKPSVEEAYGSKSVNHEDYGDWFAFDVTNLVNGWVDGSFANHGIWLRGPENSGDDSSYRSFYSMNTSSAPYLSITYAGTTHIVKNLANHNEMDAPLSWIHAHSAKEATSSSILCQNSSDANQKCLNTVP